MAFPVAAAISAYSQSNHTFNLTGSYNGTTLSATLTFTPGMSAMFEGQTTSTATTSVTIAQNGTTISSGTSVSYFTLNPFKQIGAVVTAGSGTGQYSVDANWQALPASATAGQSGSIDTETVYTDNTKTTTFATTLNTWSLATASSSTAWFCVTSVVTPISGSQSSESDCYQIDQSGNVLALKATLTVNGVTVTLQ